MQDYYMEPVITVQQIWCYVNPEQELEHAQYGEPLQLGPGGLLSRDRLVAAVQQGQTAYVGSYRLLALLRYNVDLQPDEIVEFAEQGAEPKQEPVYAEPVYAEPKQEPVYAEPVYAEPVYAEPVYAEPVFAKPNCARFLVPVQLLGDLLYRPTINVFQELNTLFIVFQARKKPHAEATRKHRSLQQQLRLATRRRYPL